MKRKKKGKNCCKKKHVEFFSALKEVPWVINFAEKTCQASLDTERCLALREGQ